MTLETITAGRPHLEGLPIPLTRTFAGAGSLNLIGTNILKAQQRGLPVFDKRCPANTGTVSIVGGGPSAEDTIKDLKGKVIAVNGSHDWLIDRGIVPRACVLLCPVEYLTEAFKFTPRDDVQYFVASLCHDNTFERLKGKNVVLWHAAQRPAAIDALLPKGMLQIGGGGFVSLRAINLNYALGFRDFHLHGFDSSWRKAPDGTHRHHVYAQERDDERVKEAETIMGYPTFLALYAQVSDFFRTVDSFERPGFDPINFTIHGDGLFQASWLKHAGSNVYRTQPGRNKAAEAANQGGKNA